MCPVPLQRWQRYFVSFLPWQLVQRNFPSPPHTLQTATALIDFSSAARWSAPPASEILMVSYALTGRSKPRFLTWTSLSSAYDQTKRTAGVSTDRYSFT